MGHMEEGSQANAPAQPSAPWSLLASGSRSRLREALAAAELRGQKAAEESLACPEPEAVPPRLDGQDRKALLVESLKWRLQMARSLRSENQELKSEIHRKEKRGAEFVQQLEQLLLEGERSYADLRARVEELLDESTQLADAEHQEEHEQQGLQEQLAEMLKYQDCCRVRVGLLMDHLVGLLSKSAEPRADDRRRDANSMLRSVLSDAEQRCFSSLQRLELFAGQLEAARRDNRFRAQRLSDMQIATTAIHERMCALQHELMLRQLAPSNGAPRSPGREKAPQANELEQAKAEEILRAAEMAREELERFLEAERREELEEPGPQILRPGTPGAHRTDDAEQVEPPKDEAPCRRPKEPFITSVLQRVGLAAAKTVEEPQTVATRRERPPVEDVQGGHESPGQEPAPRPQEPLAPRPQEPLAPSQGGQEHPARSFLPSQGGQESLAPKPSQEPLAPKPSQGRREHLTPSWGGQQLSQEPLAPKPSQEPLAPEPQEWQPREEAPERPPADLAGLETAQSTAASEAEQRPLPPTPVEHFFPAASSQDVPRGMRVSSYMEPAVYQEGLPSLTSEGSPPRSHEVEGPKLFTAATIAAAEAAAMARQPRLSEPLAFQASAWQISPRCSPPSPMATRAFTAFAGQPLRSPRPSQVPAVQHEIIEPVQRGHSVAAPPSRGRPVSCQGGLCQSWSTPMVLTTAACSSAYAPYGAPEVRRPTSTVPQVEPGRASSWERGWPVTRTFSVSPSPCRTPSPAPMPNPKATVVFTMNQGPARGPPTVQRATVPPTTASWLPSYSARATSPRAAGVLVTPRQVHVPAPSPPPAPQAPVPFAWGASLAAPPGPLVPNSARRSPEPRPSLPSAVPGPPAAASPVASGAPRPRPAVTQLSRPPGTQLTQCQVLPGCWRLTAVSPPRVPNSSGPGVPAPPPAPVPTAPPVVPAAPAVVLSAVPQVPAASRMRSNSPAWHPGYQPYQPTWPSEMPQMVPAAGLQKPRIQVSPMRYHPPTTVTYTHQLGTPRGPVGLRN